MCPCDQASASIRREPLLPSSSSDMPPQTRGRRRVAATAGAAAATLPLPSLPDEIWEQVMSHFTENSDYFGFALVCKRFRDLVRHGRQLDSTAFLWSEQPEFASIRRAELFVEWLATRVGRPCSNLLLKLVPSPFDVDLAAASIRHSLWCVLGQLAPQLTALELQGTNNLIPKVGNWTIGFSRLESLCLTAQDCGLTVAAGLAGLTRLTHLGLLVTVSPTEHPQMAEDEAHMAGFHGAHLALPEGDFLPTSLRSLCLGGPLLQALPPQVSGLTRLTALFLESRRRVPAEMLCNRLLPLAPGLKRLQIMGGMAPPAFLPRLAAFTNLFALDISRNPLWPEDDMPGADGLEEAAGQLQQGLAPLTGLTQLSIADMGLPALPPAVTAMSRLEYLECSMNLPSITLPPGTYLASLTLLAADWETLAGSTAALSSLHKLEELCLAVLPGGTGAAETAAGVLRSLAMLPRLSALYCHTESYSHDRSVKAAVKQLQRANPALQLKILKDCPF